MLLEFNCDLDGGILVADPAALGRWDRDLVAELAVALDPDGKTELTYDYPPGDWKSTWRSETQGLVERCNKGEMALLILHEGLFYIDVDVGGEKEIPSAKGAVEFRSRIGVGGREVAVAELAKLAEDWPWSRRPRKEKYYKVFPVEGGEYLVRFVIVNDPDIIHSEERVFGTPDRPAIYVQVVPWRGEVARLNELFHHAFR